jgi:nucleotide-binding universal stress UspA family protein
MRAFRTILHATAALDPSEPAFQLACRLAREHGARLIVLHVVPPPVIIYGPAPQEYLDHLSDQLKRMCVPDGAVHVKHALAEGDPAAAIVRAAKESRSDLIVMGTHGRKGLGRFLQGSVAEQVMRRAPCPVLAVKTPCPGEGAQRQSTSAHRGA